MKTLQCIASLLFLIGLIACQSVTPHATSESMGMVPEIIRESEIQTGATTVEQEENNEQIIKILLGADDTADQFTLFSDVFPQAESVVPPHIHKLHDEAFYIVNGSFEVTLGSVDNKTIESAGATVWVPRGTLHAFRTIEDGSKFAVVFTPAGWENGYNAGRALTDDQRNDEAFMKEFRATWDSYYLDLEDVEW